MSRHFLVIITFSVLVFAGCASEELSLDGVAGSACQSWEVVACDCANGTLGVSSCLADGTGFGACDACDESTLDGPEVTLGGESTGTPENDGSETTPPAPVDSRDQGPVDSGAETPEDQAPQTGEETDNPVDTTEEAYVPDDVNWIEDVKPITDAKCVGCHSASAQLGDISLAEYEDTQIMSPNCGDATVGETIVLKITEPVTCGQIMPPAGYPALSTGEVKVIEDWVLLGMPYGPAQDDATDSDSEEATNPEDTNPAEDAGMGEGPDNGEAGDAETAETEEVDAESGEEGGAEEGVEEDGVEETQEEEVVTFEDVHPIFQESCSGLACHQYSGFAQGDVNAAYQVVVEKDFANNIVDAILDGRMPANAFGFPLCSGDPSVDTNPKCLDAEEQDLVLSWYANYSGENSAGVPEGTEGEASEPTWPDAQATFADVHPILESGCSGFFCHSGGIANDDIEKAYKAVVNKGLCYTILEQVQSGAMPSGIGCSGDPVADAAIPGCLNQEEHDILESWILGDQTCPE